MGPNLNYLKTTVIGKVYWTFSTPVKIIMKLGEKSLSLFFEGEHPQILGKFKTFFLQRNPEICDVHVNVYCL